MVDKLKTAGIRDLEIMNGYGRSNEGRWSDWQQWHWDLSALFGRRNFAGGTLDFSLRISNHAFQPLPLICLNTPWASLSNSIFDLDLLAEPTQCNSEIDHWEVSIRSFVDSRLWWVPKHPPQLNCPCKESAVSDPQGPRQNQGKYRSIPRWTAVDHNEPKRTETVSCRIEPRSDMRETQMRCEEIDHYQFDAGRLSFSLKEFPRE